jgi:hypothetical protein
MLGSSVISKSSGSDQKGDISSRFAEELVEGTLLSGRTQGDQKSSLAGGHSKGVELANHEDSPRITRGVHIESFMILETGKPKVERHTQDQEGIPAGENLRGVMSCDHADSPRVTQGDHLEQWSPNCPALGPY